MAAVGRGGGVGRRHCSPPTSPPSPGLASGPRPLKGALRCPATRAQGRCALGLSSDRARQAQPRPALRPLPAPLPAPLHTSALGAAILPLPLARPSTGVNSDFQHKTKMAAMASENARMRIPQTSLAPPPLGTNPRSLKGHTPGELRVTSSGDGAQVVEGG